MQKPFWGSNRRSLALPLVAASETILDAVPSGSISTWTQQYSAGNSVVANESHHHMMDRCIKTVHIRYTYESCPVQYLTKVYDVGTRIRSRRA